MLDSASKFKNNIPSCFICKNQYDSYYRIPRVIPKCGHTFCQKCINNTVQTKANRKIFVCCQCQSQTVIRKGAAEDIPKNIGILDIVKNLKKKQFQQSSPSTHKSPSRQSPIKNKIHCRQHPSKQLDLICETCKYQKVCSICVLIGNSHQQHKFVQFIPASKLDLNQVKQVFSIIQDTIKQTILPNSQFNILKKAQQNLINSLSESVKNYFKQHYYKVIQKKQQQVLAQCKEIKFEGGISKKIQQIAKNYDILKHQYSEIYGDKKSTIQTNKTSLQFVEQFIKQCKNLHNQIELFSEHTDKQAKQFFNDISTKLNQTSYFRLTQVPFNLKNMLSQKLQPKSPFKDKSQNYNTVEVRKPKNSVDFDLKNSRFSYQASQKHTNQHEDVKSYQNISNAQQQYKKPSTASSFNTKNKSTNLPPKYKINKSQAPNQKNQLKQQQIIPPLHLNSKVIDKRSPLSIHKKASSNTQRLNKSSFQNLADGRDKRSVDKNKLNTQNKLDLSQITKFQPSQQQSNDNQPLRLKQVRPVKQIPLNLKSKYSSILKQITRQSQNQNLQLIGMQINDALIVHICQYLKTKKLKFSMIKLVKNNITDEGMSALLGYLRSDDSTQVLNLTSNQLTSKSLDLIIELGNQNNFLKNIYLSHNKISSFHMKQKALELQNLGIQINI